MQLCGISRAGNWVALASGNSTDTMSYVSEFGSFGVEFLALSQVTGDPRYWDAAYDIYRWANSTGLVSATQSCICGSSGMFNHAGQQVRPVLAADAYLLSFHRSVQQQSCANLLVLLVTAGMTMPNSHKQTCI